jgi:hypothetical protein
LVIVIAGGVIEVSVESYLEAHVWRRLSLLFTCPAGVSNVGLARGGNSLVNRESCVLPPTPIALSNQRIRAPGPIGAHRGAVDCDHREPTVLSLSGAAAINHASKLYRPAVQGRMLIILVLFVGNSNPTRARSTRPS